MQRTEQIQQAIGTDVTLGRLIGTGGVAEVYEGSDERLGRQVAIKVLREDTSAPRTRERFMREARAAAQIRHSNVLAVLDQLLFAAEQASASGNADVVDRAAGALVEIHAAIEGTVSGGPTDAAARVRDAVTRHGFASALGG